MKCKGLVVVLLAVLSSVALATDVVTNPFVGVTHIHRTLTSPRLLNINIVYIDLKAEGISFKVTPSNDGDPDDPSDDQPGETNAEAVSTFISREGAQIGINCGFFFWDTQMGGMNVMGYAASEGAIYSPFQAWQNWPQPYCALNITADNVASIIKPLSGFAPGYYVSPWGTPIYNAAPGSEWIVRDGQKLVDTTWDINTAAHPRTAAGITQDDKLILVVIDGRNSSISKGMYMTEVADLLIELGAYQGIAFDGGGSSTMVFADPYPRVLNYPSDGQERHTANNLAVFAKLNMEVPPRCVFNTFENGNEGTFTLSPAYSGSTQGILGTSTAEPTLAESLGGKWSEKIVIKDDTTVSSVNENPDGGWFVRWVSGSGASPSQNISRVVSGYLGLWAKTQTPGLKISICIDNEGASERGLPLDMIADGQWHCYEWNLDDNSQWQGWYNADGNLVKSTFTLDSVQILGPNTDATLYIDNITHDPDTSTAQANSCLDVWTMGLGLDADLNKDCYVNIDDFLLLAENWLTNNNEYDVALGASAGIIDNLDLAVMAQDWDECNDPENQECQ